MEKKKYPIHAEEYELFELIGDGGSATVHRARCIPFDEIVAVKILDFERNSDLVRLMADRFGFSKKVVFFSTSCRVRRFCS